MVLCVAHNGPTAMTPFGMVRLGPDTACMLLDKNGLNTSGYYYGDNKLLGFSHTGSSAPACTRAATCAFCPPWPRMRQTARPAREKRWGRFSHNQETGFPGYYAVFLPGDEVLAELTATPHAGFHGTRSRRPSPAPDSRCLKRARKPKCADGRLAIAPERTRSQA